MVAEESWMTPISSCCEPHVIQCNRSYCFFAEIQGSTPFWISGCTDDEFTGCDQYHIPYNSILRRCQCHTDLCNLIDRIPRCPQDSSNQTTAKSSGDMNYVKSIAWTNQIMSLSPLLLLLLASG
uniref:Acidic protein n=1 Tax=Setaria digitata TaxID=48799 RepID=A0A915PJW3_9BILA